MFNKRVLLFSASIVRRINDLLSQLSCRRSIKKRIKEAIYRGEHSVMWIKSFDNSEKRVAEYLENHKTWIERKGFNVEICKLCVIVKW